MLGSILEPNTVAGIDTCASGWYWLNPTCWKYSHTAWGQMQQFQEPPVPTSDVVASQAVTQTFFDTQSDVVGVDTGCSKTIITDPIGVCDWIIYAAGALLIMPLALTLFNSGPSRVGR